MVVLIAALSCIAPVRAEEQRALFVVVLWDKSGPSVDSVKKMEHAVPLSRGMPQLAPRFFELQDANGDVHFAGALVDPHADRAGAAESQYRLVLPDLDAARKLVIYERVKGKRTVVKEHGL
jgi:hypothetical protein